MQAIYTTYAVLISVLIWQSMNGDIMYKLAPLLKFLNAFILIGLIGCSAKVDNIPTSTATVTLVLPTSSSAPVATALPTNTFSAPEPFVRKCVELLGDGTPPPVETADNVLLLREDQTPYPPYLLNLANGIRTPISNPYIVWLYVSPDQQKIAYDTYPGSNSDIGKLVVINAKGEVINSITREQNWTAFWGWLDNSHLMITKRAEQETGTASLIVLNLSDDTRQELRSDFPNFDSVNYLPWQHNRVVYNPTLTLAVYPSFSGGTSSVTLFDISNQDALAVLPAVVGMTAQPKWSPDGNSHCRNSSSERARFVWVY
jgi:hypothetical protein